ncbi:hypothetical protein ACFLYA_01160 [Candidatus Dependentiae bacterium]
MKKQIMLLSLLLAIPSHICAKIITVENNTGKDITVFIEKGYLKMKESETADVEIGRVEHGFKSYSPSEEVLEGLGITQVPIGITWTAYEEGEEHSDLEYIKMYTMGKNIEHGIFLKPYGSSPITFHNLEKITLEPETLDPENRKHKGIYTVSLTKWASPFEGQKAEETSSSKPNLKDYKKLPVTTKTTQKEPKKAPGVPVKNETGEIITIKAASEKEFSPLEKGSEKNTVIKEVQKGVGPIIWRTLPQTTYKEPAYYQILPHGKITSVTLKPYGKYDVTIKKIIGSKTLENQAADISIGKEMQGIHIYNATGKVIQLLVKGQTKWGALKPKEEILINIKTAGIKKMKKDGPIIRWSPAPTVQEYWIHPDKKIKTENIKSIVLKPDGQYDISLKQKKNVTKTMKDKKAEKKEIQRKLEEIEIL